MSIPGKFRNDPKPDDRAPFWMPMTHMMRVMTVPLLHCDSSRCHGKQLDVVFFLHCSGTKLVGASGLKMHRLDLQELSASIRADLSVSRHQVKLRWSFSPRLIVAIKAFVAGGGSDTHTSHWLLLGRLYCCWQVCLFVGFVWLFAKKTLCGASVARAGQILQVGLEGILSSLVKEICLLRNVYLIFWTCFVFLLILYLILWKLYIG